MEICDKLNILQFHMCVYYAIIAPYSLVIILKNYVKIFEAGE